MSEAEPGTAPVRPMSGALVLLFAMACGTMVANIYYAQTLVERIGPELGLSDGVSGAITTLTQLGYGVGLFFIVPLGDLFENRRLALLTLGGTILGALGIAVSANAATFLAASMVMGICATGAQVLLPLATHLTPQDRQGAVIGQVMSGLLAGIMLARPMASFLTAWLGWRAVFVVSAGLMAAIGIALVLACPPRRPEGERHYGRLLRSTLGQFAYHRRLRLRAFYQAMLFAAFNLFWTAAPLVLIHGFGLTQHGVALFALAGAGGALAAPLAGSLADKGHGYALTFAALGIAALLFLACDLLVAGGSLIGFTLAAFLLDGAVQVNQITGQRIIFGISADSRARVNAAYMTAMFVIGASGSLLGTASYAHGGWRGAAVTGAILAGVAFAAFILFDRGASGSEGSRTRKPA
ncbi:MFS transporter [Novosphingobium sp. ZN18A2]|uniref:MFS transporter n=1 Tax=Novosphingobium sp. ZN18A2 TaxID=3079861 RepID=UPI0030D035CD